MKKTKKNFVTIVLVAILLTLAVGYAAFGGTLKISGTATANGTWNVHFANPTITQAEGNTVALSKNTTDNDTLTVTVALGYPGDGATVKVDILNEGTVDAKLTGFKVEGTGFDAGTESGDNTVVYQNGAIKVTVPTMNANESTGEVVASGKTCSVAFDVEWDENVVDVDADGQTATFTITFDYIQSTTTFTPGVSHT